MGRANRFPAVKFYFTIDTILPATHPMLWHLSNTCEKTVDTWHGAPYNSSG